YDSFDEYSNNYDIYREIQSRVGEDYNLFPEDIIEKDTKNRHSIIMDCLRLRKYILKFVNKEECKKKNCCAYVNYLLNKGIHNYYKSQKYIFKFYTSYMNHDSNKHIMNICGPEINVMGEDKYEKIKKLYTSYDLYKNFTSKKHTTPPCYSAISCANTYNKIIVEHSYLDDIKFCKAVNSFKNVFENDQYILTKKCGTSVPQLLSYPDTCNNAQETSIHGASFPEPQIGKRIDMQEASKESPYPQEEDNMRDIPNEGTTSPSSFGTTLPISLFSSGMGGLLILLSFYKFTPLGQWLKLRTQRFGGIKKNFDEELYEMQQSTSEYDERNSEYNVYNISYNSS
ncbi:PIR protein, partial [Plasmodium ovale]